jgi:ElaB/YqjD/DUF883 family membrane-anchored ribosome-binding protein
MKNTKSQSSPEELLRELQALVSEGEALLADRRPTRAVEESIDAVKSRFHDAQERFSALYQQARTRVVAGAKSTDAAIRGHPYQSVAIAVGAGLLVGLVLGRRR